MTNEMKLLMALCDAQGFDVEEVSGRKEFYSAIEPTKLIALLDTTDYKLTKKGDTQQDIDKECAKALISSKGSRLVDGDNLYIRFDGAEVFKRVNLDG